MGRVAAPGDGVVKRINPGGRVARAVRIACERLRTRSGIDDASSVTRERLHTDGRVVIPCVGQKRKTPLAVLSLPVVLFRSAGFPIAVFRLPSVFQYSALSPLAVFRSPIVLK